MSRLAFNLIIIIIDILAIFSIAVIIPMEYRKFVKKLHVTVQIIAIVLAVAILTFMLLSLDYTGEPCLTGEIVDIDTMGSFAGIYDRYMIKVIDSSGAVHEIQSVFPIYGESADTVELLAVGDNCEIYGSTVIDAFFYSVNKIE